MIDIWLPFKASVATENALAITAGIKIEGNLLLQKRSIYLGLFFRLYFNPNALVMKKNVTPMYANDPTISCKRFWYAAGTCTSITMTHQKPLKKAESDTDMNESLS